VTFGHYSSAKRLFYCCLLRCPLLLLFLIVIHLFVEESIYIGLRGSNEYRKGSQRASVFYKGLDRRLSLVSALQSSLIELIPNTTISQLLQLVITIVVSIGSGDIVQFRAF